MSDRQRRCHPERGSHEWDDGDFCVCRARFQHDGKVYSATPDAWARAVEWAAPWRDMTATWSAPRER